MLWEDLKKWSGAIEINDNRYESVEDAEKSLSSINRIDKIVLKFPGSKKETPEFDSTLYRVTVKKWMTKPASPEFDFMARWNDNIPMPLITMVGTVVRETRGMVYMDLHGDVLAERMTYCMKCGKQITNPVSQYFGMGPECGGHNYVNPFETDEELHAAVESYRRNYLQKITWKGWIVKSAIVEKEEIEGGR